MEWLKLSFDLVSSALCWPEQLSILERCKGSGVFGTGGRQPQAVRTHWWSGKNVCGTGFSILKETDK